MRYTRFTVTIIVMLSMEPLALGAVPAAMMDNAVAAVTVPFSEIMAVLGLGFVGLSIIARR